MTNPSSASPARAHSGYIPADFNAGDWQAIEPMVRGLVSRTISTREELERWLLDRSDLDAACAEARAQLYIATTCNTEDQAASAAYANYLEEVAPKLDVAEFDLDRRAVEHFERFPLDPARYGVLMRTRRASVELFRPENVPIRTEIDKLGQEFGKVAGGQTVQFDGGEKTLPQMQVYQESTDRAVREGAWRAVAERRLKDRERLNDILDQMITRRDRIARNAGFDDYLGYAFRERMRFDYTPKHCAEFWSAVEKHVVPLARRLDERRRADLGVSELRPWDLAVDPKGRSGLKPFRGGRDLMRRTQSVMDALDQRLGGMTRRLGGDVPAGDGPLVTDCLDLDSRKGKRPGGYQYMRDHTRRPFIFMNAAGLHRDVMTMVHEAGHAFHSMLCEREPLVDYRHSPIEFAEVASMSMEHLTMPHWGVAGGYYPPGSEELARARREHLEDSIVILAWIATIDSFQHWMYRFPKHTQQERDTYWLGLDARFGRGVSWDGLRSEREAAWQRQGHLFTHPMYYIEYGIAQLGALRLWLKSTREGEKAAVDAYVRALSLGGSKPLPDLFAAAGLTFDFGEGPVASVAEAVEKEIERLAV